MIGTARLRLLRAWRRRRRRHGWIPRSIPALDCRTNLRNAGPRIVHLHRVTRDIEADRSSHAVLFPGRAAGRIAATDEAIVVAFVTGSLASTETGHVVQHFRMAGCERVDSANNFRRPRRSESADRQGRELPFVCSRRRCELNDRRCRWIRHSRSRHYRRRGCGSRGWRFTWLAGRSTRPDRDHPDREPQPSDTFHTAILAPVDIRTAPPVI